MKVEAVYYTRNHKERCMYKHTHTANDYSYLQTTRNVRKIKIKKKIGEVYSVYTVLPLISYYPANNNEISSNKRIQEKKT